ncbi:hypothetical protein Salat_0512700 [Sesamum alatum]|uniref:Uncharacterized protein n=1 Tax=Sesamum alatum TaxID=300844 RepID=A0AAE1Z5G5_9LAMI|nr:hypothetical protein Salat_0512700 [Sesamum alatum]
MVRGGSCCSGGGEVAGAIISSVPKKSLEQMLVAYSNGCSFSYPPQGPRKSSEVSADGVLGVWILLETWVGEEDGLVLCCVCTVVGRWSKTSNKGVADGGRGVREGGSFVDGKTSGGGMVRVVGEKSLDRASTGGRSGGVGEAVSSVDTSEICRWALAIATNTAAKAALTAASESLISAARDRKSVKLADGLKGPLRTLIHKATYLGFMGPFIGPQKYFHGPWSPFRSNFLISLLGLLTRAINLLHVRISYVLAHESLKLGKFGDPSKPLPPIQNPYFATGHRLAVLLFVKLV